MFKIGYSENCKGHRQLVLKDDSGTILPLQKRVNIDQCVDAAEVTVTFLIDHKEISFEK